VLLDAHFSTLWPYVPAFKILPNLFFTYEVMFVAFSFGAGLLGSLVYIRMLGNSVDSMASTGTKKLIKCAIFIFFSCSLGHFSHASHASFQCRHIV